MGPATSHTLDRPLPAAPAVLANEEVIDGLSERGGHPVVRMPMKQWMLKITAYGDRWARVLAGQSLRLCGAAKAHPWEALEEEGPAGARQGGRGPACSFLGAAAAGLVVAASLPSRRCQTGLGGLKAQAGHVDAVFGCTEEGFPIPPPRVTLQAAVRPGWPGLGRLHQGDAAQLDRPVRGRQHSIQGGARRWCSSGSR